MGQSIRPYHWLYAILSSLFVVAMFSSLPTKIVVSFFIYMYVYEKYTFQGPIESPVTSSYLFFIPSINAAAYLLSYALYDTIVLH